jgi:excisionase family DNA binding protein
MEENKMSTTVMGETAYRIKHVAKLLNLNVETIRRYVRSGKIKSYHFTREYFITESQLNEFINNGIK